LDRIDLGRVERQGLALTMSNDTTSFPVLEQQAPSFTVAEASEFTKLWFREAFDVSSLVSERDQNFLLKNNKGVKFVLKIANKAESVEVLDFQNKAMNHMAQKDPSLPLPRVCLSLDKKQIHRLEINGNKHFVRVITFLRGKLLDDLPQAKREQSLMVSMGQFLGRLDRGLSDFFHPAATYPLLWDLKQTPNLQQYLTHIKDKNNLLTAQKTLDHFQEHITSKFSALRTQVIHNDMNPDNVVVKHNDSSQVAGMIDFGDMVYAPLINELAVAAAYQAVSCADLFLGTTGILKGYHSVNPLQEEEMDLLPSLVVNRIAMTAIISEWRAKEHPKNQDYILGNINRTWEALNKFQKHEYADIAEQLKNSLG